VVTEGERLRRLYAEKDLLAAQCLREGVWKRLDAPALAACVSALVHEPRLQDLADPLAERCRRRTSPRRPHRDGAASVVAVGGPRDTTHGLPPRRCPTPGWLDGAPLGLSGHRLDDGPARAADLAAGDFVRRCKQVVDLLGQISDIAPHPALRGLARSGRWARSCAAWWPPTGLD
jgi:ATP-dependent RNA helicase HelY